MFRTKFMVSLHLLDFRASRKDINKISIVTFYYTSMKLHLMIEDERYQFWERQQVSKTGNLAFCAIGPCC